MKQKIVLKVNMKRDKLRKKAMEIAVEYGATSIAIAGAEKDQLVVVGDGVDIARLAKKLEKKIGHTRIEIVVQV